MNRCLRHPIREHLLAKTVLVLDLILWLCFLPVALRILTVPALLKRLAGRTKYPPSTQIGLTAAVALVTRICNSRPFCARIFPKPCLRQSLMLYRALTRMGYPVEVHFGVLKDHEKLRGHSWATLQGQPVADTAPAGSFKIIYSCSSLQLPSAVSDDRQVRPSEIVRVLNRA